MEASPCASSSSSVTMVAINPPPQVAMRGSKGIVVRFSCACCRPHRHQRATSMSRRAREDMNVDVGDFLSCKRSIVNANGEIGGGEVMSKPTLDLGHAFIKAARSSAGGSQSLNGRATHQRWPSRRGKCPNAYQPSFGTRVGKFHPTKSSRRHGHARPGGTGVFFHCGGRTRVRLLLS